MSCKRRKRFQMMKLKINEAYVLKGYEEISNHAVKDKMYKMDSQDKKLSDLVVLWTVLEK